MALKKKIAKLEDVDEKVRGLYTEADDGDGFVLDVDGGFTDPEAELRLSEFRENNRKLKSERDRFEAVAKKFDGLDPEAVENLRKAQEAAQEAELKDLIKKGKWDEVVARKTGAVVAEKDKQIKAVNETHQAALKENAELRNRLARYTVDNEIQKTIEAAGLKPRPGAMDDILRRSREVWRLNEKGDISPIGADGQPIPSPEKAGEPITMKEFVTKKLVTEAAHLFESASGGGSGGGTKGGGAGGQKVIAGNDPVAMGRNVKEIASGKTRVQLAGE